MAEFNNSINSTVVTGTNYADSIYNTGSFVTIQGLGGNDTLFSRSDSVTIDGGAGDDSLRSGIANSSVGSNVSIVGGTGNDSVYNLGDSVTIDGGAGYDEIVNHGDSVNIDCGTEDDTVYSCERDYVLIIGNSGNDIVSNGDYVFRNGLKYNGGSNVTIDGGAGNDSLYNNDNGDNASITGGDGNDYIVNEGFYNDYVLIDGGAGNDEIYNYFAGNVSILGGTGADSIVNNGDHVTITGGAGNDLVSLGTNFYASDNIVNYSSGDGNDTVYIFDEDDTLQVAGSYSTQVSGYDVIVNVGNGSILLKNAASLSTLNIQTVPAGSFGDTTSTTTTTTPSTGTGQVISNYTGEPVTLSGSFMGATFSGNNFVVNSSAGTLTIQNVVDKVVDLRNSAGNEFVKAYKASAAGIIDGRGIASYEIIEGSSAGTDVILAGDGGSQLWGGSGTSADAIAGGLGTDIFIGGRYQGADTFYSVSSTDIVNLTDATLSDIVAAVEVNGNIALGFNTGSIITIQSTDTLSAAINLADGSAWRFNHATKSWQGA